MTVNAKRGLSIQCLPMVALAWPAKVLLPCQSLVTHAIGETFISWGGVSREAARRTSELTGGIDRTRQASWIRKDIPRNFFKIIFA